MMDQPIKDRRHLTPVFILLCVVVAMVGGSLIFQGALWQRVDDTTKNTNEVVQVVRTQTSPAAQKRQQAAIDGLIVRIDCNQRRALQDTIDTLVEQGVLRPGSLDVITDKCKEK